MCKKYRTYQTIADITVCLKTPWEEKVSSDFEVFCGTDGQVTYEAVFHPVESLEVITKAPVFKNQGFAVFPDGENGFIRRFHLSQNGEHPYALMKADLGKRQVAVNYLPGSEWCFGSSRGDFFYIGWEKILIHEKRMILHAACVETLFGGILFSGPSGIGKSTQADLWCRFAQGRLINGDKPILAKGQDGWKAYGSPYAGSSKCYVNESCKIRAIVLLKQAESCSLRRLNVSEAFRKIYAQITINSWDHEFVSMVSDLLTELIMEVPVYELACTPDRDAVELLQKTLREEKDSWI